MKEIISSLDIGSDTIKLVVGEMFNNELNVLSVSEVKSKGVKRGIIVNPDETVVSIKEVFSKCEDSLGIKINKVILTVPSYYAEFNVVEGEVDVNSEEGKVTPSDVINVLKSCVYNKVPSSKEFVAITPVEFKIDGDSKTSNPKGKKAKKLGCKAVLSMSPKKNIYTVLSMLERTGITVVDINYGSVADYYEFKNKEVDKKNSAVINIGDEKTEVSIFKKGILVETETMEIGAQNIDRDICYIYDISYEEARNLKEKFALATKRNASTSWSSDVRTNSGEMIKINQYEISDIIYSRVREILALAKKQINVLTKLEISNIIITGGVSELNDFNLVSDEVFGRELEVYKAHEIGCRHNKYSSALGLIKYYYDKLSFREKVAYTVDASMQEELINTKKKDNNNILGKIYGYFFNN